MFTERVHSHDCLHAQHQDPCRHVGKVHLYYMQIIPHVLSITIQYVIYVREYVCVFHVSGV